MRSLVSIGLFVLAALSAGHVNAAPQDRHYGDGGGQIIRCESNDNRYRHCDADTRGGVELVRGLSKTWCTQGRNWGWDRSGVWVKDGCRAEFRVRGWQGNPGNGGWNGNASQFIRCDSNDERYRACAIPPGSQVRFHRQISKTRCSEGYNWGRERNQVWVSRGCRAEFEIRRGGWAGGGWNGGNGGHDGQIVRCDSNDNRTRHCDAYVRRGVRLERQISRAACVQDRTWGWDRGGVWVSGGCRGEFRVW